LIVFGTYFRVKLGPFFILVRGRDKGCSGYDFYGFSVSVIQKSVFRFRLFENQFLGFGFEISKLTAGMGKRFWSKGFMALGKTVA